MAQKKVCRHEQAVKQQPYIIFSVEQLAFFKKSKQSRLPVWLGGERNGCFFLPAHQQHIITGFRQGRADADHPLVVGQVCGHRQANLLQIRRVLVITAKPNVSFLISGGIGVNFIGSNFNFQNISATFAAEFT